MRHHTKDKGDLGLTLVIADLMKHGIQVCLPFSEHMPFDLIAVSEKLELRKIQVKYRTSYNGGVLVPLHNTYNDKNGTHYKLMDLTEIDAFAIYCPEKETIHYILVNEILVGATTLTIRLSEPKNNQKKNIRLWDSFIDPNSLFDL